MRVFKSVLDFYINSSIHVALAVCAMSWITLLQFDLDFDLNIIIFTLLPQLQVIILSSFSGLPDFIIGD